MWKTAVFLFVLTHTSCVIANGKEKCLNGRYHKVTPTPESAQFKECHPWKSLTCCTAAFTADLAQNETRNLYNHSWHRCKQLSRSCQRYIVEQECFYQCSPYIAPWKDKSIEGAVKGVPMCASVCDRWYEACKDDETCVENVLNDYNFTKHGENLCPSNKPCMTYKAMYGSGKALCEKMWGSSYKYVMENKDSSNCMVMWFQGSNPNQRVQYKGSPSSGPRLSAPHILIMLITVPFVQAFMFVIYTAFL